MEKFGPDHAPVIHDKSGGMGNALEPTAGLLISDTVGVDGRAARIREERKGDVKFVRRPFEDLRRIVADTDQPDPGRLDLLEMGLQLAELLLAIRSPICGPVENQGDHLAFAGEFGQGVFLARLVPQCERGRLGAHRQSVRVAGRVSGPRNDRHANRRERECQGEHF